jgi:hypothetical protein
MTICQVLRKFTQKYSSADEAAAACQADYASAAKQLVAIHNFYNLQRNKCLTLEGEASIRIVAAQPSDDVQVDSCKIEFAIDGQKFKKTDILAIEIPGSEPLEFKVNAQTHDYVFRVNSVSGVYYADTHVTVNGNRIVVEISAPSRAVAWTGPSDLSDSVPYFRLRFTIRRYKNYEQHISEAARTELVIQSSDFDFAKLDDSLVFFDNGPVARLPHVANHIAQVVGDAPFNERTIMDNLMDVMPFCSQSREDAATYVYTGVTFTGFSKQLPYDLFSGDGGICASKITLGKNAAVYVRGELPFEVTVSRVRDIAYLYGLAHAAATRLGKGISQCIDEITAVFEAVSMMDAVTRLSDRYALTELKAFLFWFWTHNTFGVQYSVVEKKAAVVEELLDSWEDAAAAMDETATVEESGITPDGAAEELFKHLTLESERFMMVDVRFPWDEMTPGQVMSSYICDPSTELLTVNFRLPTNNSALAQSHIVTLKERVAKIARDHSKCTLKTGIELKYPMWTSMLMKADRDGSGVLNCRAKVKFAPGSGDAARICLLMQLVVYDGIRVYFAPFSRRTPKEMNRVFSDARYVVGTDPRATPTWLPAYAESVEHMRSLRARAAEIIKATTGVVVPAYDAGLMENQDNAEDLLMRCRVACNFDPISDLQMINYGYNYLKRIHATGVNTDAAYAALFRRHGQIIETQIKNAARALAAADVVRKSSKSLETEAAYGNASKTYRSIVFSYITLMDRRNIERSETRRRIIDAQSASTQHEIDIIEDCLRKHSVKVEKEAVRDQVARIEVANTKTLALHNSMILNYLFTDVEDDNVVDLVTTLADLNKQRYDTLVAGYLAGTHELTSAENLWAINYESEKNFKGEPIFKNASAQRHRRGRTDIARTRQLATLDEYLAPDNLKYIIQLVGEYHKRLPSEEADDFFYRLRHHVSSPNFDIARFPTEIWTSQSPTAFQDWCAAKHIENCTSLGRFDWRRANAGTIAANTLYLAAADELSTRKMELNLAGNFAYHDTISNSLLASYVRGTTAIREYHSVEVGGRQLSNSVRTEFIRVAQENLVELLNIGAGDADLENDRRDLIRTLADLQILQPGAKARENLRERATQMLIDSKGTSEKKRGQELAIAHTLLVNSIKGLEKLRQEKTQRPKKIADIELAIEKHRAKIAELENSGVEAVEIDPAELDQFIMKAYHDSIKNSKQLTYDATIFRNMAEKVLGKRLDSAIFVAQMRCGQYIAQPYLGKGPKAMGESETSSEGSEILLLPDETEAPRVQHEVAKIMPSRTRDVALVTYVTGNFSGNAFCGVPTRI